MRWAEKILLKASPPTLPAVLPHRSERSTIVIGSCHGSKYVIKGEEGKWRNGEKEEKSKDKKDISFPLAVAPHCCWDPQSEKDQPHSSPHLRLPPARSYPSSPLYQRYRLVQEFCPGRSIPQ